MAFISCNQAKTDNQNNTISSEEKESNSSETRQLSEDFKNYWFDGTAEITSYKLTQERYGELREGTAVSIFVSEEFLPNEQVKANNASDTNIPVLKLNLTKNFVTGIYPYSIMTSVFNPLENSDHAIKISNSVQEWCGQTYLQLNNKNDFEIMGHSYFQGEADQNLNLEKTWLEDEVWNIIRLNPKELPIGKIEMIPSFESIHLRHKELKAYEAFGSLSQIDSVSSYSVKYPNLDRELIIHFNSNFPFEIEKWQEANSISSLENNSLITTAIKLKRIKSEYWSKNKNENRDLRDTLQLK